MSPALLLAAALGAAPQAELLDFTAKWCGPCQSMNPIVARLHREGFPIRQVDVDRYPDLARHYNISGIPAFVLVVNGREVDRLVGATSEAGLRQLLRKIPASAPADEPQPEAGRKKSWFSWGSKDKEPPSEPPRFAEDDSAVVRLQNEDASAASAADAASAAVSASSGAPPAAQDPIQTAVRIKVRSDGETDLGSGTVIGSRSGQALILTCWHIFRELSPKSKVEVDFFPRGPEGKPQTVPGTFLAGDEKADVALVLVKGCAVMPVSPVAAADQFPKEKDHVFSIGCGQGNPPERHQHLVTRINPYEGPDTTECTGMPQVGRSGGGLFDQAGRVIGVCIAVEKESRTGVYVGPREIHRLLEKAGFGKLIPAPAGAQVAEVIPPARPEEDLGAPGGTPNPFGSGGEPPAEPPAGGTSPEPRPGFAPSGSDPSAALAALEEGAEVVCTIRPLAPGRPSEVVVINKASKRFLRYLKGELDNQPVQTSMRVPSGRISRDCLVTADLVTAVACAKAPHVAPGVALLARIFDNHGRH